MDQTYIMSDPCLHWFQVLGTMNLDTVPQKGDLLIFIFLQLDQKTISVAYRFLKAKTPEQRAAVDLDTHYSQVRRTSCFCSLFLVNQ